MYNFIAIDLDGTLLNNAHELSSRSINTLRLLSAKGVTVTIATGRSVRNVLPYIKQLDLPQSSVPVVLYNGAYGYELAKNDSGEWIATELFGFPLPEEQCKAVLDFAEATKNVAQVSTYLVSHMIDGDLRFCFIFSIIMEVLERFVQFQNPKNIWRCSNDMKILLVTHKHLWTAMMKQKKSLCRLKYSS